MSHLRKDFFDDFKVPRSLPKLLKHLVLETRDAFNQKKKAFDQIDSSRNAVVEKVNKIIKQKVL